MFRFTIRELVLLTGLGLGWWIDRSRLANARFPLPPREECYEIDQKNDKTYLFNSRTGEMWERYIE